MHRDTHTDGCDGLTLTQSPCRMPITVNNEDTNTVNVNIVQQANEDRQQVLDTEKIPFAFSKCKDVEKVGQSVFSGLCGVCGKRVSS